MSQEGSGLLPTPKGGPSSLPPPAAWEAPGHGCSFAIAEVGLVKARCV